MSIGKQIRNLRKEKNITQEQLASKLGVKRAVISKYENESVNINVNTLEKISSILGVTPSYLIGYDDKIEKSSPEYKLNYSFSQLNNIGKEKALERIDELTKIKEYTE